MVRNFPQGSVIAVRDSQRACAACGSPRTEIFGRSSDGKMVGLRCHQCGARSDMAAADDCSGAPGDITAELEAIVAIGKALTRLQNADSRRRVMAWALDRFAAPLAAAAGPGGHAPPPPPTAPPPRLPHPFSPRPPPPLLPPLAPD